MLIERKIEIYESTFKWMEMVMDRANFVRHVKGAVKDLSKALGRTGLAGASPAVIGLVFMHAGSETAASIGRGVANQRYIYEAIGLMQSGSVYDTERYADLEGMMQALTKKHPALKELVRQIISEELK